MSNYQTLCKAMNQTPFSEWEFIGITDNDEYGESHCACGHEIRYEYIFSRNTQRLIIGSKCQKLFQNPTLGTDIRKIKKDCTKSISSKNIEVIYLKQIINQWECFFYLDTRKKRKLSYKQKHQRVRINKKILKYYIMTEGTG